MSTHLSINGFCPSCGNKTLVRTPGGAVLCDNKECKMPEAVNKLLESIEIHHTVWISLDGQFTIQHPVIERLLSGHEGLAGCELHKHLCLGVAQHPGKFQVRKMAGSWTWLEMQ